jgi:hypothetical protein
MGVIAPAAHCTLSASDPFHEAGGTAGALHGLVTPVLLVVGVWPAGAHGTSGGVDDATAPVRTRQAGRPPAV